ncbi:hypothetical protein RB213_009626 [Colletotrichum asianum]|jgi:hypothetical protein
MSDP